MKKIKILRIIARLNIGGPAIHTVLLTAYLDKSRFEQTLVTGRVSADEGDMSYYALAHNVEPYVIAELKRDLNVVSDLIAFKKIYALIGKEKPDIVHTHTAKAGALGRLAAALYGSLSGRRIILIHTFHGHILNGYFNTAANKCFAFIEKVLALATYRIITVSDSVKNELISLGIAKKEKVQVIPLGFELEAFLGIPHAQKKDTLNIGIVGRLVPIKNHRLFLEAAAKVVTLRPDHKIRFSIIGDGQLRRELEELTQRLNLDKIVRFLGWETNLEKTYSELDVVALTSLNEGTPVSVIEAMASARPVIATNVGGVADLLGPERKEHIDSLLNFKVLQRGILVEPGNAEGFAQALVFLLENTGLREALGEEGRYFAKNNFSKERLLSDIGRLYTAALAE